MEMLSYTDLITLRHRRSRNAAYCSVGGRRQRRCFIEAPLVSRSNRAATIEPQFKIKSCSTLAGRAGSASVGICANLHKSL